MFLICGIYSKRYESNPNRSAARIPYPGTCYGQRAICGGRQDGGGWRRDAVAVRQRVPQRRDKAAARGGGKAGAV